MGLGPARQPERRGIRRPVDAPATPIHQVETKPTPRPKPAPEPEKHDDIRSLFDDLPQDEPDPDTDDDDVMAQVAAIAEDESRKRDQIKAIVGKLERLRNRMIES